MAWSAIAVGAVSLVGGIIKSSNAKKQQKKADELAAQGQVQQGQMTDLQKRQLGMQQTLLNARNPGEQAAYAGVQTNTANTLGAINRNSTNSNQALAASLAVGEGANRADMAIGQQSAANYDNRLAGVGVATQGLYNDQLQKYMMDRQYRMALASASMQNQESAWNDYSQVAYAGGTALGNTGWFKKK